MVRYCEGLGLTDAYARRPCRVVASTVPFSGDAFANANRLFVEVTAGNVQAIDATMARSVRCLRPEYIADYLLQPQPPPEEEYIVTLP